MDAIRFEIREHPNDFRGDEVRIFVNDVDFIEMVREHEAPMAAAEGHANLAGNYMGLDPRTVVDPDRSPFVGADPSWPGHRVAILRCVDDGEVGCWPLTCLVNLGPSRAVWRDFVNVHRRPGSFTGRVWSYKRFGPFEFDVKQYLSALDAIRDASG